MLVYRDSVGDPREPNTYQEFWAYDLEPEDAEYIREYVEENMPEYFDGCGSPVTEVTFINPYTEEEVYIEVNLEEWL